MEIKDFMDFIKNKIYSWYAKWTDNSFYPTNKIRIPVDKDAIIKNKVVSPQYYDSIVPFIDIDIKGMHCIKTD
jgi:hypothetical protein